MTTVRVNPRVGPRTFQVKYGKTVRTQVLNPGQEAELDLIDEDDLVVQGMLANGEIEIGDGKAEGKGRTSEADLRKQLAEVRVEMAKVQAERDSLRFKLNPTAILNRELAEEAGRTNADPLPEGTETENEETERVREAIGADIIDEQRERHRERLRMVAENADDTDLGPGAPGSGTVAARVLQPHDADESENGDDGGSSRRRVTRARARGKK